MDKSSRPPHPQYIKKRTPREDGRLFWGWKWKEDHWEPDYRNADFFKKASHSTAKYSRRDRQQRTGCGSVAYRMLCRAKERAQLKGVPFSLTLEDVVVPDRCPILGIALESRYGKALSDSSPSLDRIVPSLGYIRGNVIVISNLANRIKTNATPEQIQLVATFYTNLKAGA